VVEYAEESSSHDGHDHSQSGPQSTHGYALHSVGGNVEVDPSVNPELAAAAVSNNEAVLQADGKTYIANINEIDASKVELACNDDGCALIPDDGNPHNDVFVDGMLDYQDHAQQEPEQLSTHGFALERVGGHVDVHPSVDAEIAAAAVNQHEAIIQANG